jgi:ABC-type sugar transport system ATPase subunit
LVAIDQQDRARKSPILQLNSISKRYGGVQALSDVSLHVYPGEILCLVGENGAGKSTLAAIAAGLVSPDSGKIIVDGNEVVLNSPRAAESAGIRLASQELQLCPELNVMTNVLLGHYPRKKIPFLVDYASMKRKAAERLESLGLEDIDLLQNVGEMPVVYRAFVQIARSLTPGAKVLITDEPTAPMSDIEATRLLKLLKTICDQGVGIVFVSHRLDEVLNIADRVLVLRDGKLVDEMSKSEGNKERIVSSMLGHTTVDSVKASSSISADSEIAMKVENLSTSNGISETNLTLKYGEILGVYGIAGSGRDSLGMTLFGSNKPTSGKIIVGGNELKLGSIKSTMDMGIGYVPAERRAQGLLLERSIKENITLAFLRKLSKLGLIQAKSEDVAGQLWARNLSIKTDNIENAVLSLSGGNQQKVLLSRWLLTGCRILILDDPTRGVDIGSKLEIYDLLQNLAHNEKVAVLVISSDIEEVLKISDRIEVMRNGKITLSKANPTQQEVARAAYLEEAS